MLPGFDSKRIISIANKYPTPFFLFSEKKLEENYTNFYKYFSANYKNIRVDYSVKTNNELAVLKILDKLGSCMEVIAGYEILLCKEAGISASKLTFDGPYKTDADIKLALQENIHAIYADSEEEIERINKLAKELKKKIRVGVRVNLGLHSHLSGIAEVYVGKFGVKYDSVVDTYLRYKNLTNVQLVAISTHIGSQILSPKFYLQAVDKLTAAVAKLKDVGVVIEEVNLGGGFPSPTLQKMTTLALIMSQIGVEINQAPAKLAEFGLAISERFEQRVRQYQLGGIKLAFQPGRAISSSMGIALSRVKVLKDKWVFLDISTSSLPESLLFARRRLQAVDAKNLGQIRRYNVAGRGLNSADNFGINLKLPELKKNSLVAILDAGAYSISRANRFTILNPPIYLLTKNGSLKKIRREETYQDVLGPMEF